jgi:2-desacetyl-2-hydroxyethyl bacteriochlorophyllide A dehydrogenase
MLQALFSAPGHLVLEEVAEPSPAQDEVLVEVAACGICGTDRSIYRGEYPIGFPIVLGHEYAGTVVGVGSKVETLKVGDRVTVDPNVTCGTCPPCRHGRTHLCTRLSPLGIIRPGGYAQYSAVPERNAYVLTDHVSFAEAAAIEPLACCVRGIDQAQIELGSTVTILGAGPIGCLLLQLAQLRGAATVLVSEPNPSRREIATTLGATVVPGGPEEFRARVLEQTEGLGADVVIEAAGRRVTGELALGLVRRGGIVLWFGTCDPKDMIAISPYWVNENEITIKGSFNNPFTHAPALAMVTAGHVRLAPLLTDRVALTDLERALDLRNFPEAGKILVDPRTGR